MPRDHAPGRAEGSHCPGAEQTKIKKDAGPGKERQTRMQGKLRCSGDTGADRKGKSPVGKGKLHVSVVGPEGEEDRQAGPEEHKVGTREVPEVPWCARRLQIIAIMISPARMLRPNWEKQR